MFLPSKQFPLQIWQIQSVCGRRKILKQELQIWTGGALSIIKLIGMNSTFAQILNLFTYFCCKYLIEIAVKYDIFLIYSFQISKTKQFFQLQEENQLALIHMYKQACVQQTNLAVAPGIFKTAKISLDGYTEACEVLQTLHYTRKTCQVSYRCFGSCGVNANTRM